MTALSKPLTSLCPIEAGAGVSVISPASFAMPDRVEGGMERLRQLGYSPRLSTNTQMRGPLFFAGSPAQRIEDLHAAFANPETHLVAAVRGGYGSNYLLDGLDLELIRQHPKPFLAYSDMTGLQLRLLDQLGLPAFHGPMVAADFYLEDGVHLESLQSAFAGVPYSVGSRGRTADFEARYSMGNSLRRMPQHSCFADRNLVGASNREQAAIYRRCGREALPD